MAETLEQIAARLYDAVLSVGKTWSTFTTGESAREAIVDALLAAQATGRAETDARIAELEAERDEANENAKLFAREWGHVALEQGATVERGRAEGPRANRFDCAECGQGVAVDEDGCCRSCGKDATPIQRRAEGRAAPLLAKDDGLWLALDAPSGNKALINLSAGVGYGGIVSRVVNEFHAALLPSPPAPEREP